MILDLKKLFADENEIISNQYNLDISDCSSEFSFSEANVDFTIKNSLGIIKLNYTVSFSADHNCDRCMVNVKSQYKYSFNHIIVLENYDSSGEYLTVENYKLDLDKIVKDDIFLELPNKILCNTNCKGLCSKCGKNLNDGPCNCTTYQVDPRLEALKKLID